MGSPASRYPQGTAAAEVGVIGVSPVGSAALTCNQKTEGLSEEAKQGPAPLAPEAATSVPPEVGMVARTQMA